jgi:hypothetical protein
VSWDYNPYKHIELIKDDESERWWWYCHNCGGEGRFMSMLLADLEQDWLKHIRNSHAQFPDYFEDWSKY